MAPKAIQYSSHNVAILRECRDDVDRYHYQEHQILHCWTDRDRA